MPIRDIFDHDSPFIIGEIGQNHDGSLGMCHAYIDALADVGAHAVKFQTHIAAEESTADEPFRVKFSKQDETRYDYWRRMEFSEPQWRGLKEHADARGIAFLSTPFSVAAVEMLHRIGVEAWKIGSGDVLAQDMLGAVLSTDKPMIVSTGMSSWAEIDTIVSQLTAGRATFALMQCTSKYPTPLRNVGLNILPELRARYGCRVGLSDHSGSTTAPKVALARGFGLIEIHATFDRRMFGPDMSVSLTIEEIGQLVRFASEMREMDANPVDKDAIAQELAAQKTQFSRSLALAGDRAAGYRLAAEDLVLRKPGGGIPWADRDTLVGRVLRTAVPAHRLLRKEDIE